MQDDLEAQLEAAKNDWKKHRSILRRLRKKLFLDRCSSQAKHAKAKLIVGPKGRNGRTMNAALLAKHGIKKGDQPS